MDTALVNTVEEVDPPATPQQRQGQQVLAEAFARGEVVITARRADGTELPLDDEDLRGLLAVVSARALGHRVSIVAHEVLISPQTAASLLGVSRPMIYRYIERGVVHQVPEASTTVTAMTSSIRVLRRARNAIDDDLPRIAEEYQRFPEPGNTANTP
jgi:predicted DNA-binding transcriptional regulator AlpA